MSGARFHRIANVTPRTRASRGTAIEATVNAEHLLRRGVRRCLRTNAPLGETRGFRLRASGPGSRARAADEIPAQDQAHASTPATKLINCRGGRWRTAYGTTYILARPDRWSRGGNWPCDHRDCPGGSFSAAEYSWCGRSGKRRSKSGKARRRCHREYAVLSPAGASGLSPLLPATRQALLQARTPVLLLKLWSAGVSEWASSSVRKGRRSHHPSSLGPTFGPLRAIGSGTTLWSEGACALPLQWSLPRPRKPRPSPERATFLFRTCVRSSRLT